MTENKQFVDISNFVNHRYRQFWNYSNKTKNALNPIDQIPTVVRKIIYSAFLLNIKQQEERKTAELMGEVAKIHPHGNDSIIDSIKGIATPYKNDASYRILEGIGNFGSSPGETGAAGRYLFVGGTPLLSAIYKDLEFCPMIEEGGDIQPEYVSIPIPIGLIAGAQTIGVGRSNYVAERKAEDVIAWIDKLRKSNFGRKYKAPAITSVYGCEVYENPDNGYTYYYAKVLKGVSEKDHNKKGKYDIITALPPTKSASAVIQKLRDLFPSQANLIKDASGKDNPVCIWVPKGYLQRDDFAKYGLQYARKEQILIWDDEEETMRWSDVYTLAEKWYNNRCEIVTKRLRKNEENVLKSIRKIDLIKIFAENKMIDWDESEVVKYFTKLDAENGKEDASLVLSQSARAFLPENLDANALTRVKLEEEVAKIEGLIENVGDVVISEAYDIIKAQREFFGEA